MRSAILVVFILAAPIAAAAADFFATTSPCETSTPMGVTTLPACTVALDGQVNFGPCDVTCKLGVFGRATANMPGDMDVQLRLYPQSTSPTVLCVSGTIGTTTYCYGSKTIDVVLVPEACSAQVRIEAAGTANVVVYANAAIVYEVCQNLGGGAYFLKRIGT